ncbi:MAG TPA: M1 family metallopeptidase [Candidatus Aquilonibacter sp.]|nr:M1 family metallopeptidase [Candidatus Aquilonibacter sp.]
MKRLLILLSFVLAPFACAFAQRLPHEAVPENYKLVFNPDLDKATFEGDDTISIRILKPTSRITLNAVDIDFHDVTITAGGTEQKATVTPQKENEMVVLTVEKPLAAGSATIHITYSGILNNEMRGFYIGKDDQGRKYAATQFEATDARRAFPCFDEPAYKATFDITAIAPQGDIAISNGKVASDTPGPGGKHTVTFAASPKMSSYLAALVVGDFEYIEGQADGIPIRVWTTPGKKQMGQFALETAEHVLSYYNNYFSVKYPYGKLDLVGIPDFSAGAMENTACITFREVLLEIDENQGSLRLKKEIASVIAHEMAHQWFGDLVTMEWWNDIWLNEGFATWMSSKPIEQWKPEWQFNLDDVTDADRTMDTDSLASTRPIEQAANTPAQIQELFDGIAYGKAAAVLRMVESYLGEQTFRAGVNAYIQAHEYANATAKNFWDAQTETSKKPVDRIMSTFVNQPGVPVVDLKNRCSGSNSASTTSVSMDQRRYYSDRKNFEAPNDELWEIPTCMKSSDGSQNCELLSKRKGNASLSGCANWVLGNANATGYYRVAYQPEAIQALARAAESQLSPAEQIELQSNVWASVRVGREPVGDFLAVAEGLQQNRNRAVMEDLLTRLGYIGRYLVTEADRDPYRAWLRSYLNPIMNDVGWEPKPGESGEQKSLRSHLLIALGYDARDPKALEEARKVADQALQNPAAVSRELAISSVDLAALNGDQAFYDKLMAAAKTAKSPEQYYMYLFSLTQFGDAKLLERTMEYAISPEVRSQDALEVISGVMRNPAGEQLAWKFIQSHWSAVQKSGGPFASAEIVAATHSFCSARMRDEVATFYDAHKIAAAERTFHQSIESINDCVDLRSQQEPQLASWLGQHGSAAGGQ